MSKQAELLCLAIRADNAWMAELRRIYGRNACNVRYQPEGQGADNSQLRALYEAWNAANESWRDAVGLSDKPQAELNAIGEQLVIPGCERARDRGPAQLGLWD